MTPSNDPVHRAHLPYGEQHGMDGVENRDVDTLDQDDPLAASIHDDGNPL